MQHRHSKSSTRHRKGTGRGDGKHTVLATTYLFLKEYHVLFCADKQQEINKTGYVLLQMQTAKTIHHFAKAKRDRWSLKITTLFQQRA